MGRTPPDPQRRSETTGPAEHDHHDRCGDDLVGQPSTAMPASLRAGALAAIGTWSVVVLPALIGWVAAPESSVGWFSAVSVASAIWFLGHGQSVGAGTVSISVTPLLLLLVFVYIAVRWARRLAATERLRVGAGDWSRVAQWGVVPGFVLGYGLVSAVLALFTLGGPADARCRGRPGLAPRPARGARFRPAPSRRRHGSGLRPHVVPAGADLAAVGVAHGMARSGPAARARARRGRPAPRRVVDDGRRRPGPVRRQRRGPRHHLPRPARPPRQRGHVGPVVPRRSRLPGRAGSTITPPPPSPGCCRSCRCSAPCRRPPTTRRSCMPSCWLPCSSASGSGVGSTPSSSSSATRAPGWLPPRSRPSSRSPSSSAVTALGNGAVGVDRLSAVGAPLWAFAAALTAEVVGGALLYAGVLVLRERRRDASTTRLELQPRTRRPPDGRRGLTGVRGPWAPACPASGLSA